MKKVFVSNYEIYTCNPKTGEGGWEIKFVNLYSEAEDRDVAKVANRQKLTDFPNFDCVILFNYCGELDLSKSNDADVAAYANGASYRDVTNEK